MNVQDVKNLGWRVTMAGIGINLALGVLYTWSVVSKGIPKEWGWNEADRALPYSIACLVFALVMVPAGRAQDRFGPRWVALTGGIAVGLGMVLASFFTSVAGFVVGFGVLAGAGIGMGYAAATPAAVKWFPPQRTGLIAGLVVAGFGLASVYISPLAQYLILPSFELSLGAWTRQVSGLGLGVQQTMLILGLGFLVVVGVLSQLLSVPPTGWKPALPAGAGSKVARPAVEYPWQKMLATPQFYLMWVMYVFASGAGLMIIAKLAKIVDVQAGLKAGFLFVALLAVGNAGGRIVAGVMSDRIGRKATLMVVFLFQALLMFILPLATRDQPWAFWVLSPLLGANYGANLALFPAATKDYFGLKNFGVNYGWVFTAWGVGGFVFPYISGRVYDATGKFTLAYYIAGGCLLAAAAIALFLKAPRIAQAPAAPVLAPGAATTAKPT